MGLITSEWDPGNRVAVQMEWAQSMRAAVLCRVQLVVRVHDDGVVSLNLHRHAGVSVRLCLHVQQSVYCPSVARTCTAASVYCHSERR